MDIRIFTDGSSLGNPGPGGYCAIIKTPSKKIVVKGGEAHTTNNRMEMSAAIAALYYLRKKLPKLKECTIYSDSILLVNTIKQNWKKKKNTDLWQQLIRLISEFDKVEWHWIKGHSGHPENTEADKVAVKEALKRKLHRGKKVDEKNILPSKVEPVQSTLI
ncbi:MAG: ribonuclease H [Patescibacteria group bacterium]